MSGTTEYYRTVHNVLSCLHARDLRDFQQLTTDDERLQFLFKKEGLSQLFSVEPKYYKKSSPEAKIYRERGNSCYKNKDLELSLDNYNKSVLLAPWPRYIDITDKLSVDGSEGHSGQETPQKPESDDVSRSWNYRQYQYLSKTPEASPKRSQCKNATDVPTLGTRLYSIVVNEATDGTMCEEAENKELALALGNRSAVLYQLGYYQECLADIDLALLLGFPRHLRYKLFDRKGRSLLEQGLRTQARLCFTSELESFCSSNLNSKQIEKLSEVCHKQMELCDTASVPLGISNSSAKRVPNYKVMPTVARPSKQFSCASDSFSVTYQPTEGRHAVTIRNVGIGDVVVNEAPFTAVLDSKQYELRCFHCTGCLPRNPTPCQNCSSARYCSNRCRLSSWDGYHKWECQYLELLNSSGAGMLAQLAMRTILVGGWKQLVKCRSKFKPEKDEQSCASVLNSAGDTFTRGFSSLYTLLRHSASRDPNELLQFSILAWYLLKVIKYSEFMEEINDLSLKDKQKLQKIGDVDVLVGGALLRFIQIIMCNGIEITEVEIGEVLSKSHPTSIGLGLYPCTSFINHSCDPSMELLFYGQRCVAKTLRNLKQSSKFTIDYGYLYYVTNKKQRQLSLKSQYFFDCDCDACALNWPLKSHLPDGIAPLKCLDCKAPLKLYSASKPTEVKCRECGALHDTMNYHQTLRASSRECERMLAKARNFEIMDAIPVIEGHITLLDRYVSLPWREYTECISVLKQCYRLMANASREVVVKGQLSDEDD